MRRRALIKNIALITGAAFVGSNIFLSGCKNEGKNIKNNFSKNDLLLLDEIAETILPKTDTPGAKDAEVGKFIVTYINDCYNDIDIQKIQSGIKYVKIQAQNKFNNSFVKLSQNQKTELLNTISTEATLFNKQKANGGEIHYFTLIKQITLLGFFTSEIGSTKVLRYEQMPGKYIGIIDYKEGDTSWA